MPAQFPISRMRRLRATPQLRELFRETEINPRDLVLPIFVDEGASDFIDITSMPGVRRIPEAKLAQEIERYARAGLRSVMTFGISHHKDGHGSDTLNPDGLVARMSRIIKDAVPEMVVMSDTCFCEYTDHGHCGILHGDTVDNDSTVLNLGKQAVIAAQAGADIIAPSAAMDGQVAAIRSALDAAGFQDTPVMAYSTKFASGLYGPFRDAAGSTLKGDRKTYQMDPMNRREAIRESLIDEAEGADALMVSGEYAMIKFAAQAGAIDERRVVQETLGAIKRAGADMIFTRLFGYHGALPNLNQLMPLKISRILHAGYVFECEGTAIAFDPIVENPFSRNCHAFPSVRFDLDAVRRLRWDAVFISHFHDDHCSLDSLDALDRATPIYLYCVFDELFVMLRALGFTHVQRLHVDVPVRVGAIEVIPRRALDDDVDSLFQVRAGGLN
eukprot:gene20714-24877_t